MIRPTRRPKRLTISIRQQTVVPGDVGPGQVHRAERLFRTRLVTEERAGLGEAGKDALIVKERVLVSIHGHDIRLVRVPVEDHELVIPPIFSDAVYQPKMAAALPALLAVKDHA